MNNTPHIIVVVGPTASGKSDFAIDLALKENGEIISADSRQVFKELDIGTGKITQKEMKGIPHHMLSVYGLDEDVSVARYVCDAYPILLDIIQRGKTPIICGGTGQYIDALIFDSTIPPVPPNKKLREHLESKSTEELFQELLTKDKLRATSIDSHNRVRIIRALEIVETLGNVPPAITPAFQFPTTIYIMEPTRELLRERITKRLIQRLEIGMEQEVQSLIDKGYVGTILKKFGLEYATIGNYILGQLTIDQMKEELITKSMQYAKRQQTWNKKYLPHATIIKVTQ